MLKSAIREFAARRGYSIRHVGAASEVGGVELVRDIRVRLASDDPVVFDVGANIGQTIDDIQRAFPAARITAFEPAPDLAATLQSRYAPRVTIESIALSDSVGTATLHIQERSVNTSLLPSAYSNERTAAVVVPTDTVDHYCTSHNVPLIDWLKVDAQGFDLAVLRGAQEMLTRRAVRIVTAEVMFVRMYEGQSTALELLAFGESVGYEFAGAYEQTFWENRLAYSNLCWVCPAH